MPVLRRGVFWAAFSLVWLLYAVPFFHAYFFPSPMSQLAGMLDRATLVDCLLDTDRPRPTLLEIGLLTTSGERVVGEIYQHELTLRKDWTGSHYRAHSVNTGVDGHYYATNSQLHLNADGRTIVRIDIKTCDRLVDSAEARSSHTVLQEQCAVPVRHVTCKARVEPAR